jgi:hypothetical protein
LTDQKLSSGCEAACSRERPVVPWASIAATLLVVGTATACSVPARNPQPSDSEVAEVIGRAVVDHVRSTASSLHGATVETLESSDVGAERFTWVLPSDYAMSLRRLLRDQALPIDGTVHITVNDGPVNRGVGWVDIAIAYDPTDRATFLSFISSYCSTRGVRLSVDTDHRCMSLDPEDLVASSRDVALELGGGVVLLSLSRSRR